MATCQKVQQLANVLATEHPGYIYENIYMHVQPMST